MKREDQIMNAIIDLSQNLKKLEVRMDQKFAKVNLAIGELRVSYMKLDESFKEATNASNALLKNHEKRILKLENHDTGNFVSEPRAEYSKIKSKIKSKSKKKK